MKLYTDSELDTFALGERLGQRARPGSVYCLDGGLGAGKTVFARGFAAGLGVKEPVTSPTFILLKEYCSGRCPLYHFDIYRIGDPEELAAIGAEEYFYGSGVCLVEWAELAAELIPEDAVHIRISRPDPAQPDRMEIEIEPEECYEDTGH